ncbi:subunit beta of DNA-directed RNA polymerase [Hamiltosporidium tvaerminnensis]|uniref:DNA-directed RNA polymerase subunit beta n=1 Tax=Hamiltosporidium tvaerminnensis TaxID=1176355 RepID=A0A4Q9LZW8_9MICR|nr:subunit beta of DNA-directed RNA polymerase [Hamiltosporidium tvaerminnensis]
MQKDYKKLKSLFYPHISSYNTFISTLPSIISQLPPLQLTYNTTQIHLKFTSFKLHKPHLSDTEYLHSGIKLFPYECTHRNITYKGRITIEYTLTYNNTTRTHQLECGNLPIMIGSVLCNTTGNKIDTKGNKLDTKGIKGSKIDNKSNTNNTNTISNTNNNKNNSIFVSPGGYFIINGHQKVVRLLIAPKRNYWFAYTKPTHKKKSPLFTPFSVTTRTVYNEIGHTLTLHYQRDGGVTARFYFNRNEIRIPVIILLRALTSYTDKDMYTFICTGNKGGDIEGVGGDSDIEGVGGVNDKDSNYRGVNNNTNYHPVNNNTNYHPVNNNTHHPFINNTFTKLVNQFLLSDTCYSTDVCKEVLERDTRIPFKTLISIICTHVESVIHKEYFLLLGIRKLFMLVSGSLESEDPDCYANHEVLGVSNMLCSLVREKLEEMLRGVSYMVSKIGGKSSNSRDILEGVKNSKEVEGVSDSRDILEGVSNSTSKQHPVSNSTSIQHPVNISTSKQHPVKNTPNNTNPYAKTLGGKSIDEVLRWVLNKVDTNIGLKIEKFLSTGNAKFVYASDIMQSSGFSVYAENINFMRYLSYFRSINRGAFFSTLKTTTVRKLKAESWGFMCPVHTPDGSPCGLIMHLCMECRIGETESLSDSVLYGMGVIPIECLLGDNDSKEVGGDKDMMIEGVSDKGSNIKGVSNNIDNIKGVSDTTNTLHPVNNLSNKQHPVNTNLNKQHPSKPNNLYNTPYFISLDGKVIGYTLTPFKLTDTLRTYRCLNNLSFEIVCYPLNTNNLINICTTPNRFIRPIYNKIIGKPEFIGIMEQPYLDIELCRNDYIDKEEGVSNSIDDYRGVIDMDSKQQGLSNMDNKQQGLSNTTNNYNTVNNNTYKQQGLSNTSYNYNPVNNTTITTPNYNPITSTSNNTFLYSELDPSYFLSLTAALTPFSDFNQSPRNMYQCQMAKQSMGWGCYNINDRSDSKLYEITYNQTPIVQTKFYKKYILSDYPTGVNCMVSVLSYTGYDMEDAMVLNKGSIERGLFNGFIYKNEIIEFDNIIRESSRDSRLDGSRDGKSDNNNNSVNNCCSSVKLPLVGQVLYYGCEYYFTDKQYFYKNTEKSIVSNIRVYSKGAVITLRIQRNPYIGDKFCSRHGQKGVCSYLYESSDMVFMENGECPDLIINPHAFPSRMSIGMFIESLSGKSGCLRGKIEDGTAFKGWSDIVCGSDMLGSDVLGGDMLEGVSDKDSSLEGLNNSIDKQQGLNNSTSSYKGVNNSLYKQRGVNKSTNNYKGVNNSTNNYKGVNNCANTYHPTNHTTNTSAIDFFGNLLVKYGYNYYGTECMYSGISGRMFKSDVYTGVVYYQRLRHMVSDKYQVRSIGPVQSQTRQPVGGRKRMGGIRLGEMERDALIGHGVSYLLNDRSMKCSDGTEFLWCCVCKSVMFVCGGVCECGSGSYRGVKMPYVFKYLCSELMAMNIRVKIEVM